MTQPNPLKVDGLGTPLRKLRERFGKEGAEFAAQLGIDASTLSKYERGRRSIPFSVFEQIAAFTNQSPVALLVWCMREKFPEIGDTSNDITRFMQDALARLEEKLT